MSVTTLRIGTRASALALWQARYVQQVLEDHQVSAELVEITTKGDEILNVPLAQIGDKALFTKELDLALLANRIDLAVHSLKDLPTTLPDGIVLAAVSERANPFDVFVAHPDFDGDIEELPDGATIATSSLRRSAQLKVWRRDINIESVRGNVGTRLAKLDSSQWHGMILAHAGLARLGLQDRIRQIVPRTIMVPAVSQGALGIVCREGDEAVASIVRRVVHDEPTARCVFAERAFLKTLEGGCSVPIGAHATLEEDRLSLEGSVSALDGSQHFRDRAEGSAALPEDLGTHLARELLQRGADSVLDEVRRRLPK